MNTYEFAYILFYLYNCHASGGDNRIYLTNLENTTPPP